MVEILKKLGCDEFVNLYNMLDEISVPIKTNTSGRRGFGVHRSCTFGMTKARYSGEIGLSYNSKKHPEIYNELLRIGRLICGDTPPTPTSSGIGFNAIQLNKDVVCPRHIDSNNVGESVLVSFGEYSGCNIVVEINDISHILDADCQPIRFDGSKHYHYNTDDLVGTKYSLVFFKIQGAPML